MPLLCSFSLLFNKINREQDERMIHPGLIFKAFEGFFNGDDDPEKPRLIHNGSTNIMEDDSQSADSLELQANVDGEDESYDVLGPQQDAQEFLIYILSQLHEEQVKALPEKEKGQNEDNWNEVQTKRGRQQKVKVQKLGLKSDHITTVISSLFQGKFRNTFVSTRGKKETSVSTLPFFDVQLEVANKEVDSVDEALRNYFKEEIITDGDDEVGKIESKFEVLPKVLIIQLKRFEFDMQKMIAFKTRKKVRVLEELTIDEDLLSEKCKRILNRNGVYEVNYKLFSMVAHEGRSINYGHYVNYSYANGWHSFNDEYVSPIRSFERDIRDNENAYLLFYALSS